MGKVAVLGYGTVGSGVVEVIEKNRELIEKRAGTSLQIKYILDLRDFPEDLFADKIVHDAELILKDPDIDIVCETMGGIEPAYTFTKRALMAGKSVCTSNKELVAKCGAELIAIAKKNCCNYLFEASVGGGIPIIRPLNSALTAERVLEISGILNGTTNYILTKMEREGAQFETVLKEAQDKGYAEKNPEADVEGYDACRKIAILTSLVAGKTVDFKDVYTEGITKITPADFAYAKEMGMTIKLLATSKEEEGGYMAAVAPYLLSNENPLFMVNDVFNAVFVRGNTLGETMYYGKGAGKLPTASAVVSDVIDCAKHPGKHIICLWEEEKAKLLDFGKSKGRFFVRIPLIEKEQAENLFAKPEFIGLKAYPDEIGFITQVMSEEEFAGKIVKLPGMRSRIRVK